jgi:hypothetical protein
MAHGQPSFKFVLGLPREVASNKGGRTMNGYERIVNRFSNKGFFLEAYEIDQISRVAAGRSDRFDIPLDSHISGIIGEKGFTIKLPSYYHPRNRKAAGRDKQALLVMTGKRFRAGLARSLTACGFGVVKPQNIHIAKPNF